ncbi:MAG TPA: hypothetical protein VNX25_09355 [Verrucomicrobiae bacterium]|nr:hypothetical protein [Verrucomicrobiae bacterium]
MMTFGLIVFSLYLALWLVTFAAVVVSAVCGPAEIRRERSLSSDMTSTSISAIPSEMAASHQ